MDTARRVALQIRRECGLEGAAPSFVALLRLAADMGVHVDLEWPLPGRVRSVYGYGSIALKRGLSPGWQRWCVGHELGHAVLHYAGNHLYLARRDADLLSRRESEAEAFSGFLLFGDLDPLPKGVREVMGLAEASGLPMVATMRWVRMVRHAPATLLRHATGAAV